MTTSTGQALLSLPFMSMPLLIPSFDAGGEFTGEPYKAELVLARSHLGGARMHVWFKPDPRPHNHPWALISSRVIHGWYRSIEHRPIPLDERTPVPEHQFSEHHVVLREGDDEHIVRYTTYHQLVEIMPGTVSLMSFGPVVGDGKQWGHLVRAADGTMKHEPNVPNPKFLDAMRHLNPHTRPEGWVDPYASFPTVSLQDLIKRTYT